MRGISLNPKDKVDVIQPLPVARGCMAVDFHFNSSLFFYADDRKNLIGQVSRVGTAKKTIFDRGLRKPQGLAVDWVAGNLFWTDSGNNVIEVGSLKFHVLRYIFRILRGDVFGSESTTSHCCG